MISTSSFLIIMAMSLTSYTFVTPSTSDDSTQPQVLILGGGVSGIIAARTLHEHGIDSFKIVEARSELGGRLKSFTFGTAGNQNTLELGANWVQGTVTDNGPENPIWTLAKKHGLKTHYNDWYGSITTYDDTGPVDYLATFDASGDQFENLTIAAGARVQKQSVDTSSRTGYSMIGVKPKTKQALASEYYQLDWESAGSPEESSWIATSWANNFTYLPEYGGFGDSNQMSLDPRGFKHFIQAEATEFLSPSQLLLNSTVGKISYTTQGANVTLVDGTILHADYVISTFSLGVLQNDDVVFEPPLPAWKQEAIQSMSIKQATYTKVFLQFPNKFWFDTEMALYADDERGRYPVWQSLDHPNFLPNSSILFVTVTGDFSERLEALSDVQVQGEVMSVVRSMFPNVTVPDPVAFYFPRWHSDPLYRGSYSNWPPSFFGQHHQNLQATVDGRLWFAGEHTSQKYFGFLHGAYFSGTSVGAALAACVKNAGCAQYQHVDEVTNALPYQL